ncbi:hypothetical protein SAMN02745823_01005 [Sporobacter termitidis DSM 10068]|uniref:2TM domain-containing protein n=1 Tax=Sporobacter termitidis DSM 10068 TaxID=1123282 RepID=A0A1M5VSQ8_9FIRM|nr:permease prefix domain 1-containing protein [Sporobacter termitidis]SHH78281.1 hypothetical protein SAMN02745823_01005 [Sporobacter termitidis DSM 10068]
MSRIEEHVHRIFRQIPDSERKTQLTKEIIQDLEEKVADLMSAGKTEEDAVNKAIIDFGDIDDLKAELMPAVKRHREHGLSLAYSIAGSILIILLVVFANFYYTPGVIWCVYPIFAVLWWPLSMLYLYLKRR